SCAECCAAKHTLFWSQLLDVDSQPALGPRCRAIWRLTAFGPFNHAHTCAAEVVFEAQRIDLLSVFDAVEVEVIEGRPAKIFFEEGECWAVNRLADTQPRADALREGCLARAEIAMQEHHVAWLQKLPQPYAELSRLL